MKRLFMMLFITLLFTNNINIAQEFTLSGSAITYELNGGRFGDNLLSYSRAKWISYLYNIPLKIYPFPFSDQLKIHEQEEMLCINDFKHIVRLENEVTQNSFSKNNTLYINHWRTKVTINWNDLTFIAQLKDTIAPKSELELITIPEGYVSIAVHIRNGGGFAADTTQEKERCPLRFVSDEFFIDQVKRIVELYENQQFYLYIFTDHQKPEKLAKKFKLALNNSNVIIDYHKKDNKHNLNVLEDFFSMMQFDCLVRPGSHFSRFVERLGSAQLVIYPDSVKYLHDKTAVIDVIGVKKRLSNGKWSTEKITIVS